MGSMERILSEHLPGARLAVEVIFASAKNQKYMEIFASAKILSTGKCGPFCKQMPDAILAIMSGLPLAGLSCTSKINPLRYLAVLLR